MNSLVNYSSKKIPAMYGRVFAFEEQRIGENTYTMRVTKCFYHEFFKAQGEPHLTQLFCEWDRNWIEPISVRKHRVRFTRLETIASGGSCCPFTFHRVT
ncbi:L-2-amino-thiazoline-4-carboxylic acid hydrolase [Halioglobus sp. HI00S01]|uniref:L-2-amino-thiazoline-4-carboxylic acid hydrolase n=1 Tax=Halioglobus sp. HI00S01 TaxID=1822214 RepID=UPI00350EA691